MAPKANTPLSSETETPSQGNALPPLHKRRVFDRNRNLYNAMRGWVLTQHNCIKKAKKEQHNTEKQLTDLCEGLRILQLLACYLRTEYKEEKERAYSEKAVKNLEQAIEHAQTIEKQIKDYQTSINSQNFNKHNGEEAQQIRISALDAINKIPAFDSALLMYDRIRLCQRIYSFAEALTVWGVAGVEQLRLASTSLDAICTASDVFSTLESVSSIAHTFSLIFSVLGICLMFLDAFIQMCLAFKKRKGETPAEHKNESKTTGNLY